MSAEALAELVRELLRTPLALVWAAVAWALDHLHRWRPVSACLAAAGALGTALLLSWQLQRSLNRSFEEDPERRYTLLQLAWLEARHAFVLLPLLPFWAAVLVLRAAWRLLVRVGRWLRRVLTRRRAPDAPSVQAPTEEPVLVATLGPSCLLAGVVTAALYVLARLAEPLIADRLGLSPGLSAWQHLLLGLRPELAWYLPLQRFPFFAALLATLLWLAIWSVVASAVRLVHHRPLGRNLHGAADDARRLALWPRWFATRSLHEPARAYRAWARWPVLAAAPLLAWGWLSLAGDPYRLRPSEVAMAAVLWLSWSLHVGVLRGVRRDPSHDEAEAPGAVAPRHGWEAVLQELEATHRLRRPDPVEESPGRTLAQAPRDPRTARILSPLVEELLETAVPGGRSAEGGGPPRLTPMQSGVLTTLALQGFVHSDPPLDLDRLELAPAETDALEDRSGMRCRNQVVLSPEGTGKSTLALLAVTNHTLVHTRTSLVVVSGRARAEGLHERFRGALEPSTLRWNVRVRAPGKDLMTDLARGLLPDVLVTDLHDLVVTVLEQSESFTPFLERLGLVVVDDVEAFSGPAEVHAQLALRRLLRLAEEACGARELGGKERSGPQLLALGVEGMHETSEWVQSLCGVDAVTRRFGDDHTVEAPARQRTYRLRDFRSETGEHLLAGDLVAACERRAVPWHYRVCGDERRDLGRGPLLLPDEPLHFTPYPEEACVVFLEGTWSEVRQERRRLRRAGTRFVERPGGPDKPEPVAFVTLVDPDLETAFTQLDARFVLSPVLDSLPRPVIRPPTGLAVGPHLAADLTQHWMEVEEVLQVFGNPTAHTLRALAREGLLLAERRRDVDAKANRYVDRVHVQALARAVAPEGEGSNGGPPGTLPPKVSQVELVAPASLAVRDRTSLVTLDQVDAGAAHLLYYLGRIFKDARGTFVVVGRASEASGGGAEQDPGRQGIEGGDVLAEPFLEDAISTPRRRFAIRTLATEERGELLAAAGGTFFDPARVLLGRHPVGLALQPVGVSVRHVGTYWLGPLHGEVRQRTLDESRIESPPPELRTVGLFLLPNPAVREVAGGASETDAEEPPRLTLGGCRLVAAAMRAVLPNLYRGGGESLGVALHLRDHPPAGGDRHVLGPDEGLVLFDLADRGNGAARAVQRDGVDLLLRLCRLVIERVLSLHRLLALHDEWGVAEEIEAEARRERGADVESRAERRRARDGELRRETLEWLDSRVRPEGGGEAQQELARRFGSGGEGGEGEVADLGRCWYSDDGSVGDLLWVKHRWQRPGAGEAVLDVGFGRDILAAARSLFDRADDPRWAELREGFERYRDDRGDAYGRRHGRSVTREQPVRHPAPSSDHGETRLDAVGDAMARLQALHREAWAGLEESGPALAGLVSHLSDALAEGSGPPGPAPPAELPEHLAAFVQGIPSAPGDPDPERRIALRPPVETLLHRSGDEGAKALLLAAMLHAADVDTGLFASPAEGRIYAAAPGTVEADAPPALWARAGDRDLVAIDTTRYRRAGHVPVREPETWVFLPLLRRPGGDRARTGAATASEEEPGPPRMREEIEGERDEP